MFVESEKNVSKLKNFWVEFFADRRDGGHRSSDEEFIFMEAKEKLFHLDGGKTLLDFGCGAGELLVYYAPEYEQLVGVDFSESMLDEASKKIKERKYDNISLIQADDKTVWDKLECSFDRITAAGVIQLFTLQELDSFISNASNYLNKGGKIVLFDILDPRLYPLWKMGLFSQDADLWKILRKIGFEFKVMLSASLSNRPRDILGFAHNPYAVKKIADRYGFETIFVKSMYYEYKYHAIISRTSEAQKV
ncbi:class I SAM-dependent methyltransferase [Methanosarcina barkeri]|uniref:Methyltransferase n=1 Tax=Methanosarcina barkeri CM1 TaxID=796385 RepID=A0A0G3CBB4_METBA|nr:methyltransferase domain-containing protein [Methanosarcina barkeri]AKJ39289.1 methyltransferase [Methanosarcina barkeri CM1]